MFTLLCLLNMTDLVLPKINDSHIQTSGIYFRMWTDSGVLLTISLKLSSNISNLISIKDSSTNDYRWAKKKIVVMDYFPVALSLYNFA